LGEPARGAVDFGNGGRPIGRRRGGYLSERHESKQIGLRFPNARICLASAFRTQNKFYILPISASLLSHSNPVIARSAFPSWRVDMKREVDLIEEVGRLYGIEKIPSTPPRGALGSNTFDSGMTRLPKRDAFLPVWV